MECSRGVVKLFFIKKKQLLDPVSWLFPVGIVPECRSRVILNWQAAASWFCGQLNRQSWYLHTSLIHERKKALVTGLEIYRPESECLLFLASVWIGNKCLRKLWKSSMCFPPMGLVLNARTNIQHRGSQILLWLQAMWYQEPQVLLLITQAIQCLLSLLDSVAQNPFPLCSQSSSCILPIHYSSNSALKYTFLQGRNYVAAFFGDSFVEL